MKKKNQKSQLSFSSNPLTPISFSSLRTSPISNLATTLKSLHSSKSPISTPTSITIAQRPSIDTDFQSTSDQGISMKPEDSYSKLSVRLKLKEKQIKILEEENKKLSNMKSSENWEKELIKRNDEVRKLEALVVYFRDLIAQNADSYKLLQVIEAQSRKITELESQVEDLKAEKLGEYQKNLVKLEADNFRLRKNLSSRSFSVEDYEKLMKKIEDLEKDYKSVCKEKLELIDQLAKLKLNSSPNSMLTIMQDIWKIRKEINKLLGIVENIHKGKEISLKGLLGIDFEQFSEPSLQLYNDVQKIKSDLNKISTILSDFHATQCADLICTPQ